MRHQKPEELEILKKLPKGAARKTLLFVHGANCGAWCWEEHFLPYFAKNGYKSYALSFSGHGASSGHSRLRHFGIEDYCADILRCIETLPEPPILIGHSMGGYVIQKLLERYCAPMAVMLCSVPPQGLISPVLGLTMYHPALASQLVQWSFSGIMDRKTLSLAMFADPLPDALLDRYLELFQDESKRAIMDMVWHQMPSQFSVLSTPIKVIGASKDNLITADEVRATGRYFEVAPVWVADLGHAVMLENQWERAAQTLLTVLETHK